MAKKYYSEASMACHQSARDLYKICAINTTKMKEFDETCFVSKAEPVDEAEYFEEVEPWCGFGMSYIKTGIPAVSNLSLDNQSEGNISSARIGNEQSITAK